MPVVQGAILLDDVAVGTHLVQARQRETTLYGARFPLRRPQPVGAVGALIDQHGAVVEQAIAAMAAWRGHACAPSLPSESAGRSLWSGQSSRPVRVCPAWDKIRATSRIA